MGGRGTSSGLTGGSAAPDQTQAPVTQPAPQQQPQPQPQPQQQQPTPKPTTYGRLPMSETAYMAQQHFTAATQAAVNQYLIPYATAGSLYSPSQQINHALRQGAALTAAQKRMMAGLDAGMRLDAGMHDLGHDLNMTRYDRIGYMSRLLGGRDYTRMTENQLKAALVGKSYVDKAYVSVSHDRFRNAPGGNSFTDKAVEIRVHAKASTKALMPGDGAGGKFGEIILGRGQTFKIVDVKMPAGQRGRSGANYYQKVVVTVEVE